MTQPPPMAHKGFSKTAKIIIATLVVACVALASTILLLSRPSQNSNNPQNNNASNQNNTWVTIATYENWRIGNYELEPFKVSGEKFRVTWVFGSDEESKKNMNRTISKYINDTLISKNHPLLQIKLDNQTHILQNNEAVYYRFFGLVLSYDDCKVWDNIAFGSIFKVLSYSGNVFQGEAVFEGKGKIGMYVEPLPIYSTDFGGSWNWNITVEEHE